MSLLHMELEIVIYGKEFLTKVSMLKLQGILR
nr:MAG TPA: hypothetical protein [Caudoviricetes sp.]